MERVSQPDFPMRQLSNKTLRNRKSYARPSDFNLSQIQSAASVQLPGEIGSSLPVDQTPSPMIKKILDFNSKLHSQDQPIIIPKKTTAETSPKSSFYKLFKKLQNQDSIEENLPVQSEGLKLPLPQKNEEEEQENNVLPSVTPSTRRNIFGFMNKKQKSWSNWKPQEDEQDSLFQDLGFELDNVLIEFPFGIISPYGYFRKAWDCLMAFLLIYVCLVLPVRLSFSRSPEMFKADRSTDFEDQFLMVDIICDTLLLMDIMVNFFSAYENVAGLLFSKRKDIAKQYLRSWFFVDLISVFPINRNIFSLPNIDSENLTFNFTNYRIWRIVRFIKLIRVFKLYDTIERLFSTLTLNVDKIKIIKFAAFIILFIHVTGCMWNALAELENNHTWLDIERSDSAPIAEKYVTAIYFGLTTLLTIGYGNIHPYGTTERAATIIWMFFGIIVYTYIFSAMTISFAKLNELKSAEEEKDLFYREWILTFQLPYETLDVILSTVGSENPSQNTHKMEAINHASDVLADLPKGLYIDIYNYIFKEIMEKVDFFRHRPRHFVIKLVPLLKPANFEKGDFIYKEGNPAAEVFFIVKGRVLSKCQDKFGQEKIQIFVEGSLFGEVDIFLKRNRTATLRAEDKSELWKINKKEFLKLLDEFPAIKEEVENLVKIKELYRMPMIAGPNIEDEYERILNKDTLQGTQLYHSSQIFNVLSDKMKNKIKKGRYFDSSHSKNVYESLDFEPDLPSPDAINGYGLTSPFESFEDYDLDNNEKFKPMRKVSSLVDIDKSPENDLLQKTFTQKRRSLDTEDINSKDKSASSFRSERVKRSLVQWEINFQAKKRLLEELRLKGIEINDTSEIDRVIQKDDNIQRVKENIETKSDNILTTTQEMIEKTERLLAALDLYEEGIDQIANIQKSEAKIEE